MERGVIASPGIITIHGDGFTMERSISPQEVRYYAMYWDKVVIPGSNLVYIGIPEEDLLIESGVIERPRVQFSGRWSGVDVGRSFAIAQATVAEKLIQEDKSTDWVIHQIGTDLSVPSDYRDRRNALRFELVNLLPVPSADVPIVDVLEFKYRRADELNNLHSKIESAYLEALKSPDPDLSERLAISELSEAIRDLQKASSERWNRTSQFDFSVDLNIDGGHLIQSMAAGAVIDTLTHGLHIPIATVIGGIASMLRFKAGYTTSFRPAANQDKLAYLSHARDERLL